MTALTLLLSLQAFGALFGACAAVWGELVYIRAMRDGKIDKAEQSHMWSIGAGLRFGMLLLLASSLGLVVLAYRDGLDSQPAVTASYWILIVLSLFVVWASWALSRARVSFSAGSAIVFTGWWFLVYLTFGWLPLFSFGAAVASYVVLTFIFYALLQSLRYVALGKHRK